MIEHVFRNLTDIRVFDVFYCEYCDGEEVDVNEILEILEYPRCEYIQIKDSVEHLVKQHILEKVYNKIEGYCGCRTCLYTDKLKLPRLGEHKSHTPYEKVETEFPCYRIAINDVTNYIWKALFEHMRLECNGVEKENNKTKQNNGNY